MPLFWLSIAFLSGILLGEFLGWSVVYWGVLAVAAVLGSILLPLGKRYLKNSVIVQAISDTHYRAAVLLLLAISLGGMRYQSSLPDITPEFVAWYNDLDDPYIVEGVIVAPPEDSDSYTSLRVMVDQLHPVGEHLFTPVKGLILAHVLPDGGWQYGDRVRLEGKLETPLENEEFSYKTYLAHQGVYSTISCYRDIFEQGCALLLLHNQGNPVLAWIYALRERSLQLVYQLFPDPEASLAAGILLGIESGIPESVQKAFKVTGTSHIIVISGFNFAIIASLFVRGFGRWFGRWKGMVLALLSIAFYAIFVGGGAAVMRAAVMGSTSVVARQLGRRQSGLSSLLFVGAVLGVLDPHVLWDISFQLSFMATMGLVLYADPLAQSFLNWASRFMPHATAQRLVGPVGEYILFTLAAQLTTLPVSIYHFQSLSLVSLIANPLILPAQPALMVLGGISVILALVHLPLGQLVGFLVWPFLVYTIRVVELLSKMPSAGVSLQRVSLWTVVTFYVLLFAWTNFGSRVKDWLLKRFEGIPPRWVVIGFISTALLTGIVWQMVVSAPDGRLHMYVFNVGSGDGLLIRTPTGHNVLIDGGPSPSKLSDALGRRLPLLQRKLDFLVVAAAGEEQIGALPSVVDRFQPANVLWAGPPAGDYSARQLRQRLAEMKVPMTNALTGHVLELGEGASMHVLSVSRRGAVLLISWGSFRVLLPIGLDFNSMEDLQIEHSLDPVTILLLSESGYAPLNTREWITRWQPQLILLSVSSGDRDGRPDPETLAAVEGYTLLRTDLHGWLHVSTDGVHMWVEAER